MKQKLGMDDDTIRNRADINQQYKDSESYEARMKTKKKKPTGFIGETSAALDSRKAALKGLGMLFAFLFFTPPLIAQTSSPTMIVKKFVGETTTFSWEYDVADEDITQEFRLRWTDDLTKTTIDLKAVPKNLRGTSISSSFTPGFKFTYYNVVAVGTGTIGTSVPSNTVATERIGRPPRNLANQ
jgi:hypothetical protein